MVKIIKNKHILEFQIYNKGKQISKRSNLYWSDAFELLEVKKHLEVDSIDIQIYTDGFKGNEMPLTDVEGLKTIEEAQKWITFTMGELIKKGNEKEKS